MSRHWQVASVGLLLGATLYAGCAMPRAVPAARPSRHAQFFEQLVVHSDFEVPTQHRLLAELVALRSRVATELALPTSDEPIHIYLFDSPERFAAYVEDQYPDFPHRRAFFVESDTQLVVYAQWGDRVAEDLRHEVAHGYLHAVVSGLPLWLDEGLAEYYEVPRGHWGLNGQHLKRLLTEYDAGIWKPDLARLERTASIGELTQLDYAEAWAWVHLLLRTSSDRALILREYLARLRIDGAAESVAGRLGESGALREGLLIEHLRSVVSNPRPLEEVTLP